MKNSFSLRQIREIGQGVKKVKYPTRLGRWTFGYGNWVPRLVSPYITWTLLKLFPGITPNMVSYSMICVCIGGLILLLKGFFIWGGIVLYFSIVLDKVDGEIARVKSLYSNRGVFLDYEYHFIYCQCFLFMAMNIFMLKDNHYIFLFGAINSLLLVNQRYMKISYQKIMMKSHGNVGKLPTVDFSNIEPPLLNMIISILSNIIRSDIIAVFLIVFGTLYYRYPIAPVRFEEVYLTVLAIITLVFFTNGFGRQISKSQIRDNRPGKPFFLKRMYLPMKLYDKKNKRLVYIEEKATPEFWDRRWDIPAFKQTVKMSVNDRLCLGILRKYIPNKQEPILEGGCGIGNLVYCMHVHGYNCIGIDFAEKTISRIKNALPELNVMVGDVRNLPFADNYFRGYFSLGVIEHFWFGYDDVLKEMQRVLVKGGYLFLSFPYMSLLRKLKAKFALYDEFKMELMDQQQFYQFAFDAKTVIKDLKASGFRLISSSSKQAVGGLIKEVSLFNKPLFQKFYLYNGRNLFIRGFRFLLDKILATFAGHVIYLVLQKE